MELIALPAFSDNYIWMLHDGARSLVVDPGDAAVAQQTLDARQFELATILVMHRPADTVGGAGGAGGADDDAPPFCGDALLSAGCGRLVEDSLATRVCSPHEYPLSSLHFAHAVEAENSTIATDMAWCEDGRAQGRPTLPSTIGREREISPFPRCQERSEWKYQFR